MPNLANRYIYFQGRDFYGDIMSDEALGINGELSSSQMLHYISRGRYTPTIEDMIEAFTKYMSEKSKKKIEQRIEGDFYNWGIKTEVFPNALIKTVTAPTTGNVGQTHSEFTFCVDKPAFIEGDILRTNSERQILVLSNAVVASGGSGYLYTGRLNTSDSLDFLPPSDYDGIKSRVVKMGTAYSKGSYGNPFWQYQGMSKYRTPLQILRKSVQVDGSALTREKMMICYDRVTGQKVWWREELEKVLRDFDTELNLTFLFGKSAVRQDGTTPLINKDGKPVYTFDGLYECVANANYLSVPEFSLNSLEDLLSEIMTITKEHGVYNMKFLALCGLQAYRKIQKALSKELGHIPAVTNNELFIRKSNYKNEDGLGGVQPFNALEIGWTINKVILLGCEVYIAHCPAFDSAIYNPDIDIDTGFPTKSNEILFLNMSDYEDDIPNVVMVSRTGNGVDRKTRISYVDGMHSLKNSGTIMMASSSYDGAEMHILSHRSIVVHYPYTCGVLSIQEPVF